MDASSFVLSGDFGYVVLVMIFSVFMLMWMGGKVGGARKKYEVPVSYSIIILHFKRHDSHLDYILIQNTKLSWQPLCYWPQFPVSSGAWILIYFKICEVYSMYMTFTNIAWILTLLCISKQVKPVN